jgi:hypothetical protein
MKLRHPAFDLGTLSARRDDSLNRINVPKISGGDYAQ